MMVSHALPIPLPFTSELYGVRLFSGCWLFAKQTFQPSYWMMLKREGFSGDLVGSSSELSLVLGMLGAEHLRAIYTLYHGTPPTHYFDFSLRGDIEHLILSGRIRAFYLNEDKAERLGNPQDVLYANPETIDLNCENPVVAQRYRLAEELAKDNMARWTQKDAEDLAYWDRFFLWRKGYEVYDVTAEAFDTVYDFIVGLKDIAVFVVELSYESAKTQLKVNRALLEMTYKGATGDIDGLRADLNKIGVMIDEKIDSAQKLIAQAEQGKRIFDALVNDPLTRNLIFDFLDSLYQSISYRESRTFKARIVFEIGIEVLLALATAGVGNIARRTAQSARATTNAIKTTKTAQRIGPFTKHALDLMTDLARVIHKPLRVEEIKPIKKLEIPDFGKLEKSELGGGGVGDGKIDVEAPTKKSDPVVQEGKDAPSHTTTAQRIAKLDHEGHAPIRHGGPNRVTDLQLEDRAVRGIDPASGTTLDAFNTFPDGSPKPHKVGRNATAFISDDALLQADDFARSSVQFEQNIATAKANGDIFVDAVEIPLKDIFGSDYQDYVRGITRQGSKNHPTGHIATDFTDGTIKAIYKLDQTGNVKLHTLYPNPKL